MWPEGQVGGPHSHALSRHPNPGSGISTLQDKGGEMILPLPYIHSHGYPAL